MSFSEAPSLEEIKVSSYFPPYVIAHALRSRPQISVWMSGIEHTPLWVSSLAGECGEPLGHHLVQANRLLTHVARDEVNHRLLVHDMSTGTLLGSIPAEEDEETSVWTENFQLVAVESGRIVLWKEKGPPQGVLEILQLDDQGKFVHQSTIFPPECAPNVGFSQKNARFIPPQFLFINPDNLDVTGVHQSSEFPVAFHLLSWSSNEARRRYESVDHSQPNDLPNDDLTVEMQASVEGYVTIPSLDSMVLARYEYAFERVDMSPSTIVQSFDNKTLQTNWIASLGHRTEFLRYNEGVGAVFAMGATQVGEVSQACISILDAETGGVRGTHIIAAPLNPCGRVSLSMPGVHCDLTASGLVVAVFGDGQYTTAPIGEFVIKGFATTADGKTITKACPNLVQASPRNGKERKQKENGAWAWVQRVFVGDDQVVLQPQREQGFVVLPLT